MSKQRMEDLLAALEGYGWRLLAEQEYPNGSRDPFKLEDDAIRWGIARRDGGPVVDLEFQAFGHLGERTDKLRDILYCDVRGTQVRLFFEKREKPEWREALSKFVRELTKLSEPPRRGSQKSSDQG
jgi:hypothetical protein